MGLLELPYNIILRGTGALHAPTEREYGLEILFIGRVVYSHHLYITIKGWGRHGEAHDEKGGADTIVRAEKRQRSRVQFHLDEFKNSEEGEHEMFG